MRLRHPKQKGSRAERRARKLLESTGYYCIKAGGSLGLFDLVAIGSADCRFIQVKSGSQYASHVEREQITLMRLPFWATKEIWRYPNRCKEPLIEFL